MKKLIFSLILIAGIVQAQEPDPNELLCYALVIEMIDAGPDNVTEEQVDAWRYLRCDEYDKEIAPAVAAYLGSKEVSNRYK